VLWVPQVLLTLLHLNIQNIRIGPKLPAFITPNVLDVLVDKIKLTPIRGARPGQRRTWRRCSTLKATVLYVQTIWYICNISHIRLTNVAQSLIFINLHRYYWTMFYMSVGRAPDSPACWLSEPCPVPQKRMVSGRDGQVEVAPQ